MAEMILPKGIVFNKNTIYETIAKYDVVPIEQILEACHVFSTTSRKLVDPTARRLENFWTRVLGGDRRYLPGTVIAQLFRDISEEPPFIKLLGPPNRYEPPSPASQLGHSRQLQAVPEESAEGLEASKSEAKARATLPLSSKVPHPILKKPRGPSASGPRPTARFASPPGSDAENDGSKDSEIASSGSTAVTHSTDSKGSSSSTARDEKKKATGGIPKKKPAAFVASTASRRRPAMPRRPSSQSSTGGTEIGSKESNSSAGSKHAGLQGAGPTVPEKQGKRSTSREKEGGDRLSAKAAGKRPANRSPTGASTPVQPVDPPMGKSATMRDTNTPKRQPASIAQSKGKLPLGETDQPKAGQIGNPHRRSDAQERPRPGAPSLANRSRSDMGSRELGRGRAPLHSLLSPSTATVSNATAQGTIIEFDENAPANEAVTNAIRDLEDNPEPDQPARRTSGASVLDSRFTPTQPSNTPTVPLGRSKSQLTLLLERQSEKKSRR